MQKLYIYKTITVYSNTVYWYNILVILVDILELCKFFISFYVTLHNIHYIQYTLSYTHNQFRLKSVKKMSLQILYAFQQKKKFTEFFFDNNLSWHAKRYCFQFHIFSTYLCSQYIRPRIIDVY